MGSFTGVATSFLLTAISRGWVGPSCWTLLQSPLPAPLTFSEPLNTSPPGCPGKLKALFVVLFERFGFASLSHGWSFFGSELAKSTVLPLLPRPNLKNVLLLRGSGLVPSPSVNWLKHQSAF